MDHKLALAKARAIYECQLFQGMGFYYKSSPITNIAKAICESLLARKNICGTYENFNGAMTCPKNPRNVMFAGNKKACGT